MPDGDCRGVGLRQCPQADATGESPFRQIHVRPVELQDFPARSPPPSVWVISLNRKCIVSSLWQANRVKYYLTVRPHVTLTEFHGLYPIGPSCHPCISGYSIRLAASLSDGVGK